jgi:hypothetical protein
VFTFLRFCCSFFCAFTCSVTNRAIFEQLYKHQPEIEQVFGGELSWERLEGKRACRIRFTSQEGGYRSQEEEWPEIQDNVIYAMDRLEKALRPHLKQLKLSGEILPIRA